MRIQRIRSEVEPEAAVERIARLSEVLTGKRALTLSMIRRLGAELGIPVELLGGLSPFRTPKKPQVSAARLRGRAAMRNAR
jgi:hypothetical protein